MIINNNLTAISAFNRLRENNAKMSGALQKLSSGLRIGDAADDAAGLAISEKMRSQIRGLDQAARNAQDGISLIQTAEGALAEVQSVLHRMRELAVQAANDVLTSEDRVSIQNEIEQLKREVDRIASATQFNGMNMLDGSMSARVSTDKPGTEVYMRDGINSRDAYGQKIDYSGNYRIEIGAAPGQGQVQKSHIFTIPVNEIIVERFENSTKEERLGLDGVMGGDNVSNTSGLFSTTVMGGGSGTWVSTRMNNSIGMPVGGTYASVFMDFSGLERGEYRLVDLIGEGFSSTCATCNMFYSVMFVYGTGNKLDHESVPPADNFLLEIDIKGATTGAEIVQRIINTIDSYPAMRDHYTQYAYNTNAPGRLIMYDNRPSTVTGTNNSTFEAFPRASDGSLVIDPIPLPPEIIYDRPLEQSSHFYSSSGRPVLQGTQTLTLTQGDGKTASIQLDSNDNIDSIIKKINDAIGLPPPPGLGQYGLNWTGANFADKFATFVAEDGLQQVPAPSGQLIESVAGTIVIRSAVPGRDGEITFSGNEELLKSLGLQEIVSSEETVFHVDAYEAHTNKSVAQNVNAAGNVIYGLINPAYDVKISASSATSVSWNNDTRSFEWASADEKDTTFIHLVNNALTLHIGANQLQDVIVAIGNFDAKALGVSNILVNSIPRANDAIGLIDKALNMISTARAKLGAIQNRLEHAIGSLTVSSENLTGSESRIRDADMAKEMIEFTKYNILSQSASAMLAQANMIPQSVLRLLG